jgi:AraC family transcriptional regulator
VKVEIVEFPETMVAVVEHRGPPEQEHESVRKLVAWKIGNGFLDAAKHRHYGVHYTDPTAVPPDQHRVDFCLSIEEPVPENTLGVVAGLIPACRCARARDIGSRYDNMAAAFLFREWLPGSGEERGDFPVFFHYVNVGPDVAESDMITDVYLPLR